MQAMKQRYRDDITYRPFAHAAARHVHVHSRRTQSRYRCPAGLSARSTGIVLPHCIIETGLIRLDSPGSVSDHLIAGRAIIRAASIRSPVGTSHNAE
ncbi:hypothetical protein ACV229_18950 [Burkholderia sp. MR1-5-21]